MEPKDPLTPDEPCGPVREDAFEYLDDAEPLPASRRLEIRRHLDACPLCESHFRSAAALQAALPLWEAPRASAGFVERVVEAAGRDASPRFAGPLRRLAARRLSVPLPIAAAAAVLLCAAIAASLFFSAGGRTSPSHGSSGGIPTLAYSADVAAPAVLTFVSGPDPSVVSRVLRPSSAKR